MEESRGYSVSGEHEAGGNRALNYSVRGEHEAGTVKPKIIVQREEH